MTDSNLMELVGVAKEAALAGGAELLRWQGRFQTHEKGPSDYVTDADLASQKVVRETLVSRFPEHLFVGEESQGDPPDANDERICWVVDPLDGTTNYLHGNPYFSVSIAAVRKGQPVVGVIFNPVSHELFWAAEGAGAWLGEQRLATSKVDQLSDALMAVSLPHSVHAESPDLTDFSDVAPYCQGLLRTGSAALNLAFVAAGRLDAFWAREIQVWDIAAGVLLVREAGGDVTNAQGQPLNVWHPPCFACCGAALRHELQKKLP